MFAQLETTLLALANAMPLELFVITASFIEEVVAPIPSPAVMVSAGTLASIQGYTIAGLAILAVLGAIGKTVGGLVVYVVTDKAEDFIMHRLSRYIGVTHEDVESFGARLGNGWKDYFLLTLLRGLPIVPSVVISVGCGVLKVPLPLYITSTFIGTIVRDSLYLYFGYVGAEALGILLTESETVETALQYGAVLIVAILVGYSSYRTLRKKK